MDNNTKPTNSDLLNECSKLAKTVKIKIPTPTNHDMLLLDNYDYILGLDEVGRGCVAGEIVCGGVLVSKDNVNALEGIVADSKKISESKRIKIHSFIQKNFEHHIASVSAEDIDSNGIQPANLCVFQETINYFVAKYPASKILVLIDGNLKGLKGNLKTIIKGESISCSIAAGSILAKVYRDNKMITESTLYPQYGFEKHKGYGTKLHIDSIKTHGMCPLHRRTFLTKI